MRSNQTAELSGSILGDLHQKRQPHTQKNPERLKTARALISALGVPRDDDRNTASDFGYAVGNGNVCQLAAAIKRVGGARVMDLLIRVFSCALCIFAKYKVSRYNLQLSEFTNSTIPRGRIPKSVTPLKSIVLASLSQGM